MHKDDLFKLLETDEVKNNPKLHTEIYKVWNNSYSEVDIRELSINACEYLLDNGLDPSKSLSSVLNGGYSYSDPIYKETLHQIELAKFLIEKGATFKDVYWIPNSFPYETYQYLLDHGMDPSCLIRKLGDISGERHDQVLELILSKDIDWNKVSLSCSISLADLEKLLELGLDSSKALSSVLNGGYSYSYPISKEVLHQIELAKFLIEKGATFKDVHWIPDSFPTETYQYLLEHGMDPACLLRKLGDIEPGERHDQILELALNQKIDWGNFYNFLGFSLEVIEKFLDNGLKPDVLLGETLQGLIKNYEPKSEEYNSASLSDKQKEFLELAIERGADLNKAFARFNKDNSVSYRIIDDQKIYNVIPDNIFKVFLQDYALDPTLALEYSVLRNMIELAKLSIDYGADVNSKSSDQDLSLFLELARGEHIEMLDLFVANTSNIEITVEEYILSIMNAGFRFSTELVEKLPIIDDNQLYEVWRSHGSSESKSKGFLDLHNLIKEFSLAKQGMKTSLSSEEIDILDGKYCIANITAYQDIKCTNKYGYSPLHLSIISGKYDEAVKMIKGGADIYSASNNNITPIQLLGNDFGKNDKTDIASVMSEIIDDVDIEVDAGETIADSLIENELIQKTILSKTKDQLFSFLKEDADLFLPSQNTSKTSIAISHGEDFWSTGVWSVSRLITKSYPDVQFYLVNDDMVQKGGEDFIKQFDAVINPGAGDSYPKDLEEFSKQDCSFDMPLEQHYQNMLNQTEQFYIPYLGMCAGAQHFSMYHGGKIKSLDGYSMGHHQITFIKGTLPHFLSLNKDQQEKALSNCEFPEVTFKGDTAHHYAAVNDNLGDGMQLGAVSEDGVAMAYMHSNIRFATQYHPEHHYANSSEVNYQAFWLDNFVDMAVMHHDYRVNSGVHPMEYFASVQEKLSGCMSMQEVVVLSGDDISSL